MKSSGLASVVGRTSYTDLMRIIVAGADGFIGGHIVDELLRHEVEVLALVGPTATRQSPQRARLEALDLELAQGDPADSDWVFSLLKRAGLTETNFVINAVQLDRPGLSPAQYEDVNVGAATGLLDACGRTGIEAFLQISSTAIYGDRLPSFPIAEGRTFRPLGPAEQSIAMTERAVRTYRRRVPVVVVRPAPTFGPRQRGSMKALFDHIADHDRPRLVAGGTAPVSLAYVTDLARAVWGLIDHAADVIDGKFHVKSFDTDWRSLVVESQRLLGRPGVVRAVPLRIASLSARIGLREWLLHPPSGVPWYVERIGHPHLIDDNRLQAAIGFEPVFGLGAALLQTLEALTTDRPELRDLGGRR